MKRVVTKRHSEIVGERTFINKILNLSLLVDREPVPQKGH